MAFMKFYVGNEANASSHRDGIYIAIDTKKIFYNGSAYGGSEVDLSGYLPLSGGKIYGDGLIISSKSHSREFPSLFMNIEDSSTWAGTIGSTGYLPTPDTQGLIVSVANNIDGSPAGKVYTCLRAGGIIFSSGMGRYSCYGENYVAIGNAPFQFEDNGCDGSINLTDTINFYSKVTYQDVYEPSKLSSISSNGFTIKDKTANDLLNAAGGTVSINDIIAKVPSPDLSSYATKEEVGSNTYTGANYISKETNLTEAVLQLDEEIKATNDNLALEHTNAEATYAKKTELGKKLDISTYTSDKATFALKSDIPNVSNFLTISNAQSTYLTKTDASNIYQPKGNYLTSVSIATISDLNANWDALLKSDPSGYVTRWPNMSEVGSKQNLVIKLNGGTTEGTNQFTYNVTAKKSINITPSSIGAAASSHTHTASQVSGLSKVATSGSYNDLTNKPSIPSAYTLPKATTSTLGGIKVGDGLEITGDGTLNCIIDPGSGTVSWGNIQGKPSVFATNIASINDLNSGWDALLKAAPNIPSLNGYATQEWVNGRGFLTKTTADGYYQPKGNYLTSVSWSQISGKPEFAAVATSGSYNDLTNKPTIPSLTGYATQSWVNSQGFAKGSFLPLTGGTISGNLIISNAGDDKNVHINANTGITLKGTGVGISLSTGGSSSKFFATDGSVQTINVADFALKSTTDTLTNITNSQDQRISNMKLGMARYISGSTATVINGDEGMVGLSGTPALYFYNGGISTDNVPIRNCIRIQGGQCYVDNNGIFITLASISTSEIDELFN